MGNETLALPAFVMGVKGFLILLKMCIIERGCIPLWVIGLQRNTRGCWQRMALGNAWCVKT